MSALISVSDLAAQRGWDRTTAWRYLKRLERDHGAKLVRQRRTLYIAPDELAKVVAGAPARNEQKTRSELAAVRRRLTAVETRQKSLESEVRQFRKLAHEWYASKR